MTTEKLVELAPANDTSEKAYSDAVSRGDYDLYQGGLTGKHDNVRTYWEDSIRRLRLRPHLQTLVRQCRKAGRKTRIIDLGAGTGEALRNLSLLNQADADLGLVQAKVLPIEEMGLYLGSDLCEAMVEQGNRNFQEHANVVFRQGDFSVGFPHKDEEPFDLYYCSYGSFSHVEDAALSHLMREIFQHAPKRAIVVGEWLGRHSIEWPCYWSKSEPQMLEYSMSWMDGSAWDDQAEPERFLQRYWIGNEIRDVVKQAAEEAGVSLRVLDLYDCSIFTGRHTDTHEYNRWVRPLRSAVNHLHEPNVRTDFQTLRAHVANVMGHRELYEYYSQLQFAWNSLVEYCDRRLSRRIMPVHVRNWNRYPAALQMAMITIDRVIDSVHWMEMGDPRANIIEPQLGYALRSLEMDFQQGKGRGHSLVGIFEVRKD